MITFPTSMRVFERGWLSSNNVLFIDNGRDQRDAHGIRSALVDSGYAIHVPQTVALVRQALDNERTLDLIVNTHLHSDHCGGNALLQSNFICETLIPQKEADAVREWDEDKLTFRATGQSCERFGFTGTIPPGDDAPTWGPRLVGARRPRSRSAFADVVLR